MIPLFLPAKAQSPRKDQLLLEGNRIVFPCDVRQIAGGGMTAAAFAFAFEVSLARLRIEYTPTASPANSAARRADPGRDETEAWLAAEDRVRAIDGTMRVTSAGTTVIAEVELPCAS